MNSLLFRRVLQVTMGVLAAWVSDTHGDLLVTQARKLFFQARLLDESSGTPEPLEGSHTLTFRLYGAPDAPLALPGGTFDVSVTLAAEDDGVVSVSFPSDPAVGLNAAIFDGRALFLGLTIDESSGGTELTPRISLGATPYAMRANHVGNTELTDDVELGSALPPFEGTLKVRNGSGTETIDMQGGDGAFGPTMTLTDGGFPTIYLDVASASGPSVRLGDNSSGDLIEISGDGTGSIDVRDNLGQSTIELVGGSSTVNVRAGGLVGVELDAGNGTTAGGTVEVSNSSGDVTVRLDGDTVAGFPPPADTDVGGLIEVMGDPTLPYPSIRIDGSDAERGLTNDGAIEILNSNGFPAVLMQSDSCQSGPRVILYKDDQLPTVELIANESQEQGGVILVGQIPQGTNGCVGFSSATLILDGQDGDGEKGALVKARNSSLIDTIILDADGGTSAPGDSIMEMRDSVGRTSILLHSNGRDEAGEITMFDDGGTDTVHIIGVDNDTASNSGGRITLNRGDGAETVVIDSAEGDTQAGVIKLFPESGSNSDESNATIELDAEYGDGGGGRIITQELEITGGSDLSEQFDVVSTTGEVEPGYVVSIDPSQPGRLRVSQDAYDRGVAGIVSGAGGVRTGMMMGQKGSLADGQHPVALTGRVWCWCDASFGPIGPGDLLTTSTTPGHAMKSIDPEKSPGAVLGKAMTPLAEGRGLVLVLVTLQ